MTEKRGKYSQEIRQMMFVGGATEEPSEETTLIVEDIVQQQIMEILARADALAHRRGTRSITNDDIIFLVRHDESKVSRLREFLAWKGVRKNAKQSDDDDFADIKDTDVPESSSAAGPEGIEPPKKIKTSNAALPWDVHSFFSEVVPGLEDEPLERLNASMDRLRKADIRTRDMTKEEYAIWTESRHASFTWRKTKKFRDWVGLNSILDSKPGEDLMDILGFLAFDSVQKLTEEALKDRDREFGPENPSQSIQPKDHGLFGVHEQQGVRLEARHVRQAFQRLQQPSLRQKRFAGLRNGMSSGVGLNLI